MSLGKCNNYLDLIWQSATWMRNTINAHAQGNLMHVHAWVKQI